MDAAVDSGDAHVYDEPDAHEGFDEHSEPWQANGAADSGHAAGHGSGGDDGGNILAHSDAEDSSWQYGGAAA